MLVRHAEAVAPSDPHHEENDRPLTDAGRRDAERLAGALAAEAADAIYSSPYPRAVQTVEPFARRVGTEISLVDDLRERLLSPGALPDWREHLQRAWTDFGYALEGGESSAEGQRRVTEVLGMLQGRHIGSRIVVASHGDLIALALHAIVPDQVDFEFWAAMPTPAVSLLPGDGTVSGPGLGD